ncbi:MAG: hypothetical protein QNJ77_15025 [Acidimicrobiia bacterium]|nr:hypothetical protein [Acidimicrobiia bacterium]
MEPPYEGAEEGLRIEISIRTYGSDRNAVEILTPLAEAIGTRN